MTILISMFDEVKRTFFPRWDKANAWQVQRKARLSDGYKTRAMCNLKKKVIEFSHGYVEKDDNELRQLLAHEICHAIVKGSHGLKWQERFLKVADRATDLGQKELADMIHSDIEHVQNASKPTLPSIHHDIEDALMCHPYASFEEVIEWVADNCCLTPNGLLKKYKSLKDYFEKAKREAIQYRKLQKNISRM